MGMRFDQTVWERLPGIMAAGYMQELLHDRTERFTRALDDAGIPYAVCGGMAVIAWITNANPDYVRNTKDVDVCVRAEDLARITDAVRPHGFVAAEVNGVQMFLDGPDGTPKHAVHVVIAGRPPNRWTREPIPDIGDGVRDAKFRWARLGIRELLVTKLIANRMHDQTHIADLWRAGVIDRGWAHQVPEHLQPLLHRIIDACEEQYGDSPH